MAINFRPLYHFRTSSGTWAMRAFNPAFAHLAAAERKALADAGEQVAPIIDADQQRPVGHIVIAPISGPSGGSREGK